MIHTVPTERAVHALTDALAAVAGGDRALGARYAGQAAEAGSDLGRLLVAALTSSPGTTGVYDAPRAFRVFIQDGGNRALYEATSVALADSYRRRRPTSLLEIGPGDGHALLPALDAAASSAPTSITLAEPSPALFDECRDRLSERGFALDPGVGPQSIQAVLGADPTRRWDLAESTFALHAVPPDQRTQVLHQLAERTERVVLAEFDVRLPPPGTAEHLRELAVRYERGLAEYQDERDLVGAGFLVPVLLGQLEPGAVRSTWEQSADEWAVQVSAAGFADVRVEPLADYWWSPAFVLTAVGST
jgi:hypothetical protein